VEKHVAMTAKKAVVDRLDTYQVNLS